MDTFGLFLMFLMLATRVMPSPNEWVDYPLGTLSCRIFQGETYRDLSCVIRNWILMYPDNDTLYSASALDEAKEYIKQCFQYPGCAG